MGLVWSLGPLPHHPQDVRLVVRDVTKPFHFHVAVFRGHIAPDDSTVAKEAVDDRLLNTVVIERMVMAPGVRRVQIRHGRVQGTLFLPPGLCFFFFQ
jgi:hypothetical protein